MRVLQPAQDFHLQSSDPGVDDGTDLSADANFAFDDDVDFDTRSGTWDIGFDEFIEEINPSLLIYVFPSTVAAHNVSVVAR